MQIISNALQFSYLIVAGAIDWNICPEVLGMTKVFFFTSAKHYQVLIIYIYIVVYAADDQFRVD